MSRIAKHIPALPEGVTVEIKKREILVKKGDKVLTLKLPDSGDKSVDEGTQARLISNAVKGLTDGFAKTLEIQGTGYKAIAKGTDLELSLGYSHLIPFKAPEGIKFEVKDNRLITVSGADKYLVGQVAANLRRLREPDPYKGKGVRYQGEVVKLKPGKAAKAAGE
jgi:large subunit ribosomal protein L6